MNRPIPKTACPKDRYRAYHVERARAGIAMTMTAGSAAVSRDSPPVFNNVLAYKDEVVGWMKKLTDECHDHGCAVMIQLTHLGRRTHWNKGRLATGTLDQPSARTGATGHSRKKMEDWDIARVITDYADAAERMAEAGLDGVELECYGHLMDQFMSPLTNELDAPYGGSLENRARFALEVVAAIKARVGDKLLVGVRYTADETAKGRHHRGGGRGHRPPVQGFRQRRFLECHPRPDPHRPGDDRTSSRCRGMKFGAATRTNRTAVPRRSRPADLSMPRAISRMWPPAPPCHRGGQARHGGNDPRQTWPIRTLVQKSHSRVREARIIPPSSAPTYCLDRI